MQGQSVVSFVSRQFLARNPALAQIEAYWELIRQGRIAPLRSEVDPRGLEAALPHAFILDRVAPGVARLRVSGGHLTDLMGMETRGMPLTALALPEARDQLATALEHVLAGGSARLQLEAAGGFGRGLLQGGMLLLPLMDQNGELTKVLGGIEMSGRIGRQPRRFAVTSNQMLAPVGATIVETKMAVGFSEEAAPWDQEPRQGLRLVVDNSRAAD